MHTKGCSIHFVLAMLALFALSLYIFDGDSLTHEERAQANGELVKVHASLELGDTVQEAYRKYTDSKSEHLVCSASLTQETSYWTIDTPTYDYSALNWVMHVEFANQQVVFVGIRILDNGQVRPADAPADKGYPQRNRGWRADGE